MLFRSIDLPNLTVTEANPAHWLAFRRFASDEVVAFNRIQVDILRELSPGRDVVHNYMGFFTEFDHHEVAADLDIAVREAPLQKVVTGLGLSTVGAQFFGGSDGNGNKTDSQGYFLQGTYKFGDTKFGINYGQNPIDVWKGLENPGVDAKEVFRPRLGLPRELIGTAVFLGSDASELVTGHIVMCDDGYLTA